MIEDPVLLWALVGTAAGILLGIAGTGGGVIAIPILMTFGGYDIKEPEFWISDKKYGRLSRS